MRFRFNPESDFEVELIDRCIKGGFIVSIEVIDETAPRHRRTYHSAVIVERHDRLMELELAGGIKVSTDTIVEITIW